MKMDIATGHFTSTHILQEPIGYVDGANLYQFVGGSPVNKVDPQGLKTLEVVNVSDWLTPKSPDTIIVFDSWYANMYKINARWSQSRLTPHDNIIDYWEPDLSTGNDCTFVIKGPIQTFMHQLSSPKVNPRAQYEAADALITSVNQIAEAHEKKVIGFLQSVWSPPKKVLDFGNLAEELTQEYNDRQKQFAAALASIEVADVAEIRSYLVDIEARLNLGK